MLQYGDERRLLNCGAGGAGFVSYEFYGLLFDATILAVNGYVGFVKLRLDNASVFDLMMEGERRDWTW